MRPTYALIDAPSPLGVGPTGVERLAEALRAAGLKEALGAENAGSVATPCISSTCAGPPGPRPAPREATRVVRRVTGRDPLGADHHQRREQLQGLTHVGHDLDRRCCGRIR
jgi:hypothetical protein